ncbi:MAG TPA: GNAT family N-acetyltransferase [Methylomirabilota bacterium]
MARVTLRALRPRDVSIVRRLVQLYIYDLVGARWGVEADGTYGSPRWHRRFWRRDGRHHFIVRVNGRPAGFALVREMPSVDDVPSREMSEFFVLRTYRRSGVGTRVARALFRRFPGRWELSVLTWNVIARPFWRRVIRRVAVGPAVTRARRQGDLTSLVWYFRTVAPRANHDVSAGDRGKRSGGRRSRSAVAARSSA